MGGFGTIARSIGSVGNDVATARQNNADLATEAAAQKLKTLMAQLQIQEIQQRLAAAGQPGQVKPVGVEKLPSGGLGGVTFNPQTGKYEIQSLAEGAAPAFDKEKFRTQLLTQANAEGATPLEKRVLSGLIGSLDSGMAPEKVMEDYNRFLTSRQEAGTPPADKLETKTFNGYEWQYDPAKKVSGVRDSTGQYVRLGKAKEPSLSAGGGGAITPDAIDMMATIFRTTGQLPAMGIGGIGLREQVFNRAAQQAKELAGGKPESTGEAAGSDIATNRATFAAQSAALSKLRQQRAAVGAFESTALKNLDLFVKAAQPIVDKGSPWINAPLRTVSQQGLGSADQAAYNAARQVALTEISRVISNPNMTGVLSDEARGQVSSLIGPGATLAQILSATKILKQDMENRKTSLDEEIGNVTSQIRGGKTPSSAAPAKPQGATHTGVGSVDHKKHWLDAQGHDLGLAE